MDKKAFQSAITVLDSLPKRNFSQSVELLVNLKNIDLKNQNNQIDMFLTLPKPHGRTVKICALVGRELEASAKKACDKVILDTDFKEYSEDKKKVKKLALEFDYFIAQATMMPQIAKIFGRVLGPHGKMPSPKAGCVVPPNANLTPIAEKLQKTIRIRTGKNPVMQLIIGKESLSKEDVLENAFGAFSTILHSLPQEQNNIKSVMLKKSMSKPVKIGGDTKTATDVTAKAPKEEAKAAPKKEKEGAEQ